MTDDEWKKRRDLVDEEMKRRLEDERRQEALKERTQSKFLNGPDTSQPSGPTEAVAREEQEKAIRKLFAERREEARQVNEEYRERERRKTIDGIRDAEMGDLLNEETARIQAKWDERLAERQAQLDREERERLERLRAIYERD